MGLSIQPNTKSEVEGNIFLFTLLLHVKRCFSNLIGISFIILFSGFSYLSAQTKSGILNGFVIDKKTDAKLSNASIIILNTNKGTYTDLRGFYELELPEGIYTAEVKMLGYQSIQKKCEIVNGEKTSLFFELETQSVVIGEVPVIGKREKENFTNKTYELLPGDLKNIPQFGEGDPLRALFSLPGINSINNLSNQLYIRGGNFDETLIALDNVPLYNPYHLGGIFSSVNSDIIKKENLYLSNYPQSLGGYLSGALDLSSKKGNFDQIRTSASLGLISSKLFVEGPLWKGTFVASLRRTYLDALTIMFREAFPYFFYDGYFNYSIPVSGNDVFECSAFYSRDVLELSFSGRYKGRYVVPKWGNMLINSKLTHVFENKSSLSLQAYLSNAYMSTDEFKEALTFDNLIKDQTIRLEYKDTNNKYYFNAGIEYKTHRLDYNWIVGDITDLRNYVNPPEEIFFDYAPNSFSFAGHEDIINSFVVDQISLSNKVTVNFGLRGSYLHSMGSFFPSASAGINYILADNISLRMNTGRYLQYLYTIKEKRPESIYTPFSVFFLSSSKNQVARSDKFSLGLNIANLPQGMEFDCEAFYNKKYNLAGSYNDDPRYRFEDGYSSGLELLIKREHGLLTGWIGYTYGRSVKRNDEYYYYTIYDRTHTIKVLLNYPLSEKWKFSAFWTYATGTPYTDIAGKYVGGVDSKSAAHNSDYARWSWRAIDGPKNGARLDDHHRLDIGVTGSFVWGSLLFNPYLQILNIYNNSNNIVLNNTLHNIYDENIIYPSTFIIPTLGVAVEF